MERTRPPPLGPEAAQSVLRRAAELDRKQAADAPMALPEEPHLEADELARVAAESGLSREAVRRALTEHQAGALVAGEKSQPPRHFVTGEAVTAEQTFDAPPEVIEARLADTLRRSGLEVAQRAPHATRWEPARGLRQTLGRVVDWGGSAAWSFATVESGVHAVPGQRTSAELRGDARKLGSPIAVVTALLLSFPAGIALLIVLAFGLRWGFSAQQGMAMLAIAAAWLALTAAISRGVARSRVKKLRRALQRVLEQVATAGLPGSSRSST
jgi:hypothetical protein